MMKRSKRMNILEDANFTCYYCGWIGNEFTMSVDHKRPVCRGGTDKNKNLVCCCRDCNNQKGDMTEGEYRVWLSKTKKIETTELLNRLKPKTIERIITGKRGNG